MICASMFVLRPMSFFFFFKWILASHTFILPLVFIQSHLIPKIHLLFMSCSWTLLHNLFDFLFVNGQAYFLYICFCNCGDLNVSAPVCICVLEHRLPVCGALWGGLWVTLLDEVRGWKHGDFKVQPSLVFLSSSCL